LRFVWAVAAFVLAAVLIGAGIAQRTIFVGADTTETEISTSDGLPYTMIDGSVLTSMPGAQTLTASVDSGPVYASYGRSADVADWLADVSYTRVSLDDSGEIVTEVVEPEQETPADTATDAPATEGEAGTDQATADGGTTDQTTTATGRNPAGSDLWLDEFTDEGTLTAQLQLPDTMSVLLASDGTAAAPATIGIRWPLDNSTPWAGPLIVAGSILMLLGVFLYLLGIRHARRSRGPRRKGIPQPVTQPLDTIPAGDAEAKGVISAGTPRRALRGGTRGFVVIPALAVAGLLFTGCTAESWPQIGASATPSPTASVIADDAQDAPVVTETQAKRILAKVAQTVSEADVAADGELASTRLAGAVLDERKANYLIRSKVADHPALPAIPTEPLQIVLPQAYDEWPRTFMTVVGEEGDTTVAPTVAVLTQEDAWSEYKLTYLASLAASAEFPGGVAPATIGAALVPPDSPFLILEPQELAAAYADVVDKGENSASASLFEEEGDQFRVKVAEDRRNRLEQFNQTGAETGSLTFSSAAGAYPAVGLATLESGAIVAVTLTETDTVKPTNSDAVIKLDGNATAEALAGTASSASGFQTNFSDQLFFYVPNQADGGQIRLLGYASNILSAGVIQ
jgi:hypothetical protein